MKSSIILFVVSISMVFAGDFYDKEFDNVGIEKLVANPETMEAFYNCFLEKKPCDEKTEKIKKVTQEIITTGCGKCTPSQKHNVRTFFIALKEKYPREYDEIKLKYDSGNKLDAFTK